MKTERRTLEDWEVAECLALKAEISDYNKRMPKEKRLTQEEIADRLGMSQGTLSSHLNGKRAINLVMASRLANMLGIEVSAFSPRLAGYIAEISRGHDSGHDTAQRISAVSGPVGSALGAVIAGCYTSSQRSDLSSVQALTELEKDIPLTFRVRQLREVISTIDDENAEDSVRSVVGVYHNSREVLELIDSILEAAASNSIDREEIEAIITLINKRRNEKDHELKLSKRQ